MSITPTIHVTSRPPDPSPHLRRPVTAAMGSSRWPTRLREGADTPHVSLLEPGDTATIATIYGQLSPATRSMRFLAPMPRMPASLLRGLAACDGHDHVVMVARFAGHPVGEGRYIRMGEGIAEVAVAIADASTGRGIAGHLVALLSHHARRRGVDRFVFSVHAENRLLLDALRRRGVTMNCIEGGRRGLPRASDAAWRGSTDTRFTDRVRSLQRRGGTRCLTTICTSRSSRPAQRAHLGSAPRRQHPCELRAEPSIER